MIPKLTKTTSTLLFFTMGDSKEYFYETKEGYSFETLTKDRQTVKLFAYKHKNEWYVNDNEGYYAMVSKEQKTRKKAIELACDTISKHSRIRINEVMQQVRESMYTRMKNRVEKELSK